MTEELQSEMFPLDTIIDKEKAKKVEHLKIIRGFGDLVSTERMKRDVKAQDFAKELEISKPTLSQIEHGDLIPAAEVVKKIVDKLSLDPMTVVEMVKKAKITVYTEKIDQMYDWLAVPDAKPVEGVQDGI